VRDELVALLERIRAHHGRAVRIVSGYRCPVHNAAIGGAANSMHMYGAAADLELGVLTAPEARSNGATGIGIKGTSAIHVDVRDGEVTEWRYS
jgi:uncharacterized protein YcbK (DUF882 family)